MSHQSLDDPDAGDDDAAPRIQQNSSEPSEVTSEPNIALSPRRQRAIDMFPFLAGLLLYEDGNRDLRQANSVAFHLMLARKGDALWDAVDNDRPLMPLLAELLGWEAWMVHHVQRYWSVFREVDGRYAHHAWDMGALLVNWTPETAPRRLIPLQRLCSLFGYATFPFPGVCSRLFLDLPKHVLNAHDRCTLLAIIEDGTRYARLREYLDFVHSLTRWLSRRSGKAVFGILPRLMGASTIADGWMLCLRWHRINDGLRGERAFPDLPTDAPPTPSLGLLTETVHRGVYSFHNVRNPLYRPREWKIMDSYQEISSSPPPGFPPCNVYVELDGIYHATLTIAIEGNDSAPKIQVLTSVARSGWPALDDDTQAVVDQFVADCNAGQIRLNRQTVAFYVSRAALQVSLLEKFRRIDYPAWLGLFAEDEYFDAHAGMTGTAVFDTYRESLALVETAEDGLYQRAVQAMQQVGEPDFEFIELVSDDP